MKNLKIAKKGTTHIEMMISFVIFISFITFMMIIFKPFKIVSINTSTLDVTESKIINYASTNLTISSLILNSSFNAGVGDCLYAYFPLPNKVIVKDENTNIVEANKSNEELYLEYKGKRVYRVSSSEELEEKNFNTASCDRLNESNYTIGVTRNYKKISYSNLAKLNNSYTNDYENLKRNLSLINDFTFIIRDSSGAIFKGEKYKPRGINIIAKDIPIEILDKNANLNPAVLNIQVWE